jgi:hypothetical protein
MVHGTMNEIDLLYGMPAIAEFLKIRPRQAYHLAETGMPTFKLGKKTCARKSALSKWLAEQERLAKEPPAPKPEPEGENHGC